MGETKEKRGSFAEVLKIKRKSYNPNMYSQCQKYMQMCSLACEDVSPLTSKSYYVFTPCPSYIIPPPQDSTDIDEHIIIKPGADPGFPEGRFTIACIIFWLHPFSIKPRPQTASSMTVSQARINS